MLRKIAALCCLVLLTGCPDYDEDIEPEPEPWDAGIPPGGGGPPLGCRQGICGDRCCPGFPGSIDGQDNGTGVLWLFRVDRSLVNLAPTYNKMATQLRTMLNASGFSVRVTAAGSLYDGTLFWTGGEGGSFEEVLRQKGALAEGGMPLNCTTSGLVSLAANLRSASIEGTTFPLRPFENGVSALLVVLVDHGDRPLNAFSDACKVGGVRSFDYFSSPTTTWVDGMVEPRLNTRFLVMHTGEETPFDAYRSHCRSIAQFPKEAIDSVEPSEIAFFREFTNGMNAHQERLVTSVDTCTASSGLAGATEGFVAQWARELIDAMPPPTGATPDAGTP